VSDVSATVDDGVAAPDDRGRAAPALLGAALLALAGVAVVLGHTAVRQLEAQTSAGVLGAVRLAPARSIGASVIFPLDGKWVGYNITPACTVALLTLPFFGAAALLVAARRVAIMRAFVAVVAFAAVVFTVNQFRFAVAAGAMRLWGFDTGYERSHIFLGTVVSTVGVLGSLAAFVYVLLAKGGGVRVRHG
jgi:hypothetical protein